LIRPAMGKISGPSGGKGNNIMKKMLCFTMVMLLVLLCGLSRADRTIVELQVSYPDDNSGEIIIELYDEQAPITVENFLSYVESGFYDGLIFHRVIDDFMIQTGIYDANLYEVDFSQGEPNLYDFKYYHKPNAPIPDEVSNGLKNDRATVAMALAGPNTGTSQFYINQNTDGNHHLDGTYTVFGMVTRGMDVVDAIANLPIQADNLYFEALPQQPVIITQASVLRKFDPNSSDFGDIPFLNADDGNIRSYIGQGDYAGEIYHQEFHQAELLGVNCLQWQQISTSPEVDSFTMYLAKDTSGEGWILKYVINEGQADEQVVIDAQDLIDAVSFDDFAQENMLFKLITGSYNSDNLADPNNTITRGSGSDMVTETIVSVSESLPPQYPADDLVLVRRATGPAGSETDVDWQYYDENIGLALDLEDDAQQITGTGWRLAPMVFDNNSNDFSAVPFLKVPAGGLVRTFVGKGEDNGHNYTHTFTVPAETALGVKYLIWQQQWADSSTPIGDIDTFTLHLTKDIDGKIWVFKYVLNDQTLLDANSILDVAPFSDFDDKMYFRLINGDYNGQNLADPNNTIVTISGSETITQKIVSLNASVDFIPHYQDEMILVKQWTGPNETDDNLSYYHESAGLIRNFRESTISLDSDGWMLAYYGGTFDAGSNDLSAVDFLRAQTNSARSYVGQGAYQGHDCTHSFTAQTLYNINWLKWKQDRDQTSAGQLDNFYIYLARDSLGTLWVQRYYVNDKRVFYADTAYDARPLSDFADENLHFKLIIGQYDPDNLADPDNTAGGTIGGQNISDRIESFSATNEYLPFYDDLVLVKRTKDPADPNVAWLYYHPSLGLILDLANRSDNPLDPNFFDPDDTSVIDENTDGWLLGWFGNPQPTFAADSFDFSVVPFLHADLGEIRLYRGQADFAGSSFRMEFTREKLLDVDTLKIAETEAAPWSRPGSTLYAAKDSTGKLWVFDALIDGEIFYQANTLARIVPFDKFPDMHLRLMADEYDATTTITAGAGGETQTEKIINLQESLDNWPDFADELVLVKRSPGTTPPAADWSYYHELTGLVEELSQNITDPNLIDPEGNGWVLAQADPNDLTDVKIKFQAGKSRQQPTDAFKLTGKFTAQAEDFNQGELVIRVGTYLANINTNDPQFRRVGAKPTIIYKGSPDGVAQLYFVADLRKGTFTFQGKNIDLTGTGSPVTVQITAGEYLGEAVAQIAGNKPAPILFLQGQADQLRQNSFRLVIWSTGPADDTLAVKGEMATQSYPLDLTGKKVTVSWSTSNFTIPAQGGFVQKGDKQIYIYRNPGGSLKQAEFNLENGSFYIYIKSSSLKSTPADLKIKIEDGSTVLFDQKITLS